MSSGLPDTRAFLDTNVLVYVYDPEAEEKQRRARRLVLDHLGARSLCLSTQVLLEFFWTVTRKPEVPIAPQVASAFSRQLQSAHIVVPTFEMAVSAMERAADAGAPIWDALILTAAESCGADVLYTEDKHLLRLESPVRIVDPFAAS